MNICEEKLINEPNMAFIQELSYLQFLQIKYCEWQLILLKDRLSPSYFAFGFPKHSPLNPIISAMYEYSVFSRNCVNLKCF